MTVQTTDPERLLRDSAWLRRLSHSLAHDAVEGDEIFNTALVASWQGGGTSPTDGPPRRWLAGLVRNRAARHRRDTLRRQQRENRAARPEAQPSAADIAERVELQRTVVDAVLELREPYASTLLLRYWDDLSPGEVAKSLAVPVETVRTRTKRGLAMLRERLDGVFGKRGAWLVPLAQWAGVEPKAAASVASITPTAGWVGGLVIAATITLIAVAAIPKPIDIVGDQRSVEPSVSADIVTAGGDDPRQLEPERVDLAAARIRSPVDSSAAKTAGATMWINRAAGLQCMDTMQQIIDAQVRCRKAKSIDVDRDSIGEFGYLAELTGQARRGSAAPFISRKRHRPHLRRRLLLYKGVAVLGEYCFQMYLPGIGGAPLREADAGGAAEPAPDPDLAERLWCCYAWPLSVENGEAGPVFFVDQEGVVLAAPNHGHRYVGIQSGPHPEAAFRRDTPGRLGNPKSDGDGEQGHDRQVWARPGLRETRVRLRVIDARGRPAAGARVFVAAIPAEQNARSARSSAAKAMRAQQSELARLGVRLPVKARDQCNADGTATVKGPVVRGAVMSLTAAGERMQRIPTRLWLQQDVLCVEIPAVDPQVRANANESAVIATLKNISSSQAQCQAGGAIDVNRNGAGEYGYFGELSGAAFLRGTDEKRMTPPVLSGAFGKLTPGRRSGGIVVRSGYCFAMFLPDAKCRGLPEAPTGGEGRVAPSAPHSEVLWCCYAWPTAYGKSGKRAFFVNQGGDVLATKNTVHRYSGRDHHPAYTAAYVATSTDPGMTKPPAANAQGEDGGRWIVMN